MATMKKRKRIKKTVYKMNGTSTITKTKAKPNLHGAKFAAHRWQITTSTKLSCVSLFLVGKLFISTMVLFSRGLGFEVRLAFSV